MSEQRRGCGYRHIGGLYLVSDPGPALVCDGLPLPILPCGCCDYEPPFSRNLQWLTVKYIQDLSQRKHETKWPCIVKNESCKCPPECPVCHPINFAPGKFGFMFVSQRYYTPDSFIQEAVTMGISKRIPEIPKDLELGKTWILLAHNKVPFGPEIEENGLRLQEPEYMKAIFYGFKPQRVEMPVWKGQLSDEQILGLEKKGIIPVFLEPSPDNRKKHGKAKTTPEDWLRI